MLTFAEFSDLIEFDRDIRSCAALFAETEVEPGEFVENFLEEDLREGWRDWLSGAGSAAMSGLSRLGRAAGEVGSSLWDGGLKSGIAKGKDTVAGPAVKFDNALKILQDLSAYLNGNDMTKNLPSAGKEGWTVGQYIKAVTKALQKEKDNMPQMQKAQVSQGMAARDGGVSADARQAPRTVASPILDKDGNPTMRKVV